MFLKRKIVIKIKKCLSKKQYRYSRFVCQSLAVYSVLLGRVKIAGCVLYLIVPKMFHFRQFFSYVKSSFYSKINMQSQYQRPLPDPLISFTVFENLYLSLFRTQAGAHFLSSRKLESFTNMHVRDRRRSLAH